MANVLPQVENKEFPPLFGEFSDLKKAFLRFQHNMNIEIESGVKKIRFNIVDNVTDGVALLNGLSDVMEACRDPANVERYDGTNTDVDGNLLTLDEWLCRNDPKTLARWRFQKANPQSIEDFIKNGTNIPKELQ